jgi:Tol biopolymer transport system component
VSPMTEDRNGNVAEFLAQAKAQAKAPAEVRERAVAAMQAACAPDIDQKEGEMEATIRFNIANQTPRAGITRARRWAFGLTMGIAVVLAIMLWYAWHPAGSSTTKVTGADTNISTQTPGTGQSVPVVIASDPNQTQQKHQQQVVVIPAPHNAQAIHVANVGKGNAQVVAARQPKVLFAVLMARNASSKGKALAAGNRLLAGVTVETGGKGRLTLITRQGSEFTLAAGSRLAVGKDGATATLKSGRLYCRNRDHEFAAISTAAGKIELLGTIVDAAVKDKRTVAVTVVQGKVRLENAYGQATVPAGRKAILNASAAPEAGEAVNIVTETAWYDGRGQVVSDFGQIAYTVKRAESTISEAWVMNRDGSGKQQVKSFIGGFWSQGQWLRGAQQFLVGTYSPEWTLPDMEKRTAITHQGNDMLDYFVRMWLLDVATGQDSPFLLPGGFSSMELVYSPDGTKVAFSAIRKTGPNGMDFEAGVWTADLQSGQISKAIDGGWTDPAWSPDGSTLAVSKPNSSNKPIDLALVRLSDGSVTITGASGSTPAFSPDGTKLVFINEYQGDYGDGYSIGPGKGRAYVMDLPNGQPRLISPQNQRVCGPAWSPDNSKILYLALRRVSSDGFPKFEWDLYVSAADGTDTKLLVANTGWKAAWSADGKTIFVVTEKDGIQAVAPDGSGVTNLGGTKEDSILSAAAQQQVSAADAAIQQAVFHFAVAKVAEFKGDVVAARAAFHTSAVIFAGLPFNYPLVNFSTGDALHYADSINALANRSDAVFLEEECKEHMDLMGTMIAWYANDHNGVFAPDLATIKAWISTKETLFNGWPMTKPDILEAMFKCTSGSEYVYTPPAAGAKPQVGEVVLTCSAHPELLQTKWQEVWEGGDLRTSIYKGYRLGPNVGRLEIPR